MAGISKPRGCVTRPGWAAFSPASSWPPLATWWRLALALLVCLDHLTDLADRAAGRGKRAARPVQLPLPWPAEAGTPAEAGMPARPLLATSRSSADRSPADRSPRPWAAKFSLLTWGAKVARRTALRSHTPALCWTLPVWEAPLWSVECQRVYAHPT